MPSFPLLLGLLLLPVAALLFLNLRLTRRLVYPLMLLLREKRKGSAAFLFRSFRAYYDAILDALIALTIAFALAGGALAGGALAGGALAGEALAGGAAEAGAAATRGSLSVVIDCSRSMLLGGSGSRPLDLAVARAKVESERPGAKVYALAFDPWRRSHRLVPIDELLRDNEPEEAARLLEQRQSFFTVDYGLLAGLPRGGADRVLLLTDRLPGPARGFEALEFGFAGPGGEASAEGREAGAYPASIGPDPLSGEYRVQLAEVGPRGAIQVQGFDEAAGGFVILSPRRYRVEELPAGRRLVLPAPGLYLLRLAPPGDFGTREGSPATEGRTGADFAFRMTVAGLPARVEGAFSTALAGIFPYLETGSRGYLALRDLAPPYELGARDRRAAAAPPPSPSAAAPRERLVASALVEGGDLVLHDPAAAGGRLLLGASPREGSLAAGVLGISPESLANEDLPLLYDGLFASSRPAAFATELPPGTDRLLPAGEAFVARTRAGFVAFNAPYEEYFAPVRGAPVELPPSPERRWLWALLLALLCGAKLALWRRFSKKRFFRRDGLPGA